MINTKQQTIEEFSDNKNICNCPKEEQIIVYDFEYKGHKSNMCAICGGNILIHTEGKKRIPKLDKLAHSPLNNQKMKGGLSKNEKTKDRNKSKSKS